LKKRLSIEAFRVQWYNSSGSMPWVQKSTTYIPGGPNYYDLSSQLTMMSWSWGKSRH